MIEYDQETEDWIT
jgi:hypothetical protein